MAIPNDSLLKVITLFLAKFQLDEHRMVQLSGIYGAFLFYGNEQRLNLFIYIV